MTMDMIQFMQAVEFGLIKKMPELNPKFILVGSTVEGTRIQSANDLDVTVQFKGVENRPLRLGNDAFTLRLAPDEDSDHHPLQPFCVNGCLDYEKFFYFFLSSLAEVIIEEEETMSALSRGRLTLPDWFRSFQRNFRRLERRMKKIPLAQKLSRISANDHGCPYLVEDRYKGNHHSHCGQCLFPVTHTKSGSCLLFNWRGGGQIVTLDLIPVFPVLGKSVADLFGSVTKTLIRSKPSNWLECIKKVINQDTILPESYKKEHNAHPEHPLHVGMKLVNYGESRNFIIRPAQQLAIHELGGGVKELYCDLKCLKTLLDVDVNSYFIKKVVLTDEISSKAKKNPNRIVNIFDALNHPGLKAKFGEKIDFKKINRGYSDFIPILSTE